MKEESTTGSPVAVGLLRSPSGKIRRARARRRSASRRRSCAPSGRTTRRRASPNDPRRSGKPYGGRSDARAAEPDGGASQLRAQLPMNPDLVVLAPGIVVASLRARELVAREELGTPCESSTWPGSCVAAARARAATAVAISPPPRIVGSCPEGRLGFVLSVGDEIASVKPSCAVTKLMSQRVPSASTRAGEARGERGHTRLAAPDVWRMVSHVRPQAPGATWSHPGLGDQLDLRERRMTSKNADRHVVRAEARSKREHGTR